MKGYKRYSLEERSEYYNTTCCKDLERRYAPIDNTIEGMRPCLRHILLHCYSQTEPSPNEER